ncbi:hypothetical protein [Methylobacterium sp. E-045]|uniref:hypothetical protein n=1 Tax=Methylobacterium sp. E-045 TaxID=2836575 RepID=UPI001FBBA202|nr:hypothetical protein [Methylobacterium sp. E-045]MCJ2131431.1 hypothetical protein [Methylobacterium sp. E-045]
MPDNVAITPIDNLMTVIGILLPDRKPHLKRHRFLATSDRQVSHAELELVAALLSDPRTDQYVDGEVAIALLRAINRSGHSGASIDALSTEVVAHVERRWADLVTSLADKAVSTYDTELIFAAFPQLLRDPILISRLVAAISDHRNYARIDDILVKVSHISTGDARLLIVALNERHLSDERSAASVKGALFAAIGRSMNWSPWIALQTLLQARPDYAHPAAIFERSGDRSRESQVAIDARLELANAIEPLCKVREVAAILLQLVGPSAGWGDQSLLSRPAEVRAAYVDRLHVAIAGDDALRRAVIEALLWLANDRTSDLAQFAAFAVAEASDRPWLIELETHPIQIVRFSARAVRAAKLGEPLTVPALPTIGGLVQSLAAIECNVAANDEAAFTWLGDRAVEQLIERTISSVESRVAREYEAHGDEGEDRLLSSLFTTLAMRFADLDQALEGLARAASAPSRVSVNMRYRNVDRAEEGKKGIRGAKSFSADLCLIVDPILDGKSLGRRVTLVQAKRLYRDHTAAIQPAWSSSFAINVDQRRSLQMQTNASVYFFHGPPLGGRGVPVIPTQLVADLSEHQGSGSQLARATVATASRSLADWLTYDALALRVGDPYTKLVAKAEGRSGSLPRRLMNIPAVNVEVAILRRSEDRR